MTFRHCSLPRLSYNLSRPYPYSWFTPLVILGGIIAATLFSLVNYAADGFDVEIKPSLSPNYTVERGHGWSHTGPFSLLNKAKASCPSVSLTVGSEVYTDKLALPYTLTSAWQMHGGVMKVLPSVSYRSNDLQNCSIKYVQIDLNTAPIQTAEQLAWSRWGPKATGFATCAFNTEIGITYLNLTTTYQLFSIYIGTGTTEGFLDLNKTSKASLWWGQSLLSWSWLQLAAIADDHKAHLPHKATALSQGSIGLYPNNISDVSSLEFFSGNYELWTNTSQVLFNRSHKNISDWHKDDKPPMIWKQTDTFAKAFYFSMMTDLGIKGPNLLTDPAALQRYTHFTRTGNKTIFGDAWGQAGPARTSYNTLKDQTGKLGVTSSTIYAQYLCTVPKQKSFGSLFVTILVADLVFLQTLWQITAWLMSSWVEFRNPHASHCEGCLHQQTSESEKLGDQSDHSTGNSGSLPTKPPSTPAQQQRQQLPDSALLPPLPFQDGSSETTQLLSPTGSTE